MPLDHYGQMEQPTIMKIDVEGFETLVIKGAKKTLADEKLHSVIMELNGSGDRYGYDEEELVHIMKEYGFSCYTYQPLLRKLIAIEGRNKQSGNTLFIRNIEWVKERLKTAPKINVHGVSF
jgi:hypothetical protein